MKLRDTEDGVLALERQSVRGRLAVVIGLLGFGLCLAGCSGEKSTKAGNLKGPTIQSLGADFGNQVDVQEPTIKAWHDVAGFSKPIAQFETVFWDPEDTVSLRRWLDQSSEVAGSRILEVGTGTGIIALKCAALKATEVVATDANAQAVLNAKYNVMHLSMGDAVRVQFAAQETGQMPGPFSTMSKTEKFDFIISNPPWEDSAIVSAASMAYYDPGFRLLVALLAESHTHLNPHGKLLLAYGAKTAIYRIQELAPEHGWEMTLVDERDLASLPEVFLPAMLIKLERAQP